MEQNLAHGASFPGYDVERGDDQRTPQQVSGDLGSYAPGTIYDQYDSLVHFDPSQGEDKYGHPGSIHYVPPSAISTRYYALSNPNEYAAVQSAATPTVNAGAPAPATNPAPHTAPLAPPPQATVTLTITPPTPSKYPARLNPVLPKQRRNRDDPGGESRPMAQPTAQHETAGAAPGPSDSQGHRADGRHGWAQGAREENPPVVPSQWKLGAELDRLRFPQFGGDWDAMMAAATGRPYERTMPRSESPLSEGDAARLEMIKTRLGLDNEDKGEGSSQAPPPTSPARTEVDIDMNRAAVYSPTSGRKLSLPTEQRVAPGTVLAKRPYKRGTPAACAFCRKRKIACGGPVEGDQERRCG
ncbi:hypothetical protein C8Q78DRAFT_1083443 [Trametes maxima]|nr:hypothetical protein C8Q78DRAFT_1083443 [Trametes maxima]